MITHVIEKLDALDASDSITVNSLEGWMWSEILDKAKTLTEVLKSAFSLTNSHEQIL